MSAANQHHPSTTNHRALQVRSDPGIEEPDHDHHAQSR